MSRSQDAKRRRSAAKRSKVVQMVARALPPGLELEDWAERLHVADALLRALGKAGHLVVPVKGGSPLEIGARYLRRAGPDGGPLFTAEDVVMLRGAEANWPWPHENGHRFGELADRLESVVVTPEPRTPTPAPGNELTPAGASDPRAPQEVLPCRNDDVPSVQEARRLRLVPRPANGSRTSSPGIVTTSLPETAPVLSLRRLRLEVRDAVQPVGRG